ncbi:hypothetical protein IQ06DRAFT_107122 [Phaeosphaeriaceae sp. SRC1lsM3a]|nr:hypothetical protein IQ06DRAFT_107122 [Stagonospora sp. SRC1lsM3a]
MVAIIIFVLAALCAPIAATKCSSSPQCPAENGCTVSTPNGAEIDLKCDTDFDGRVLKTIQAKSFSECAKKCSENSQCGGLNLKDGHCYHLGADVGIARHLSGVLGGIMVQAPSDGGDSAGHKVCGDVINCNVASTDGCHFTTGNKTYVARCETDLYGSDFENIETLSLTACVKQCSKKSACKSVSWSLGICYLKNEIPDALYSKVYGSAYLQS